MSSSDAPKKLWGGRFTGAVDPLMDAFNASIHFDKRMYAADLVGSMAYSKALAKNNIITEEERDTLVNGLQQVMDEWQGNKFVIKPGDEDIHTANERRLGEIIGPLAGKLHTGRSRNDQVATDMRLWLRDEASAILAHLKELIAVTVARAEKEIDALLPGYTHLQRAQPIRWSHFLLSYAWLWHADAERLEQLIERLNVLPLGSGALAGHAFNIDREFLAKELGFRGIINNSLYAVSDRDFVAEFLFWASLTMVHISRIAEDLIIYSSSEFGFVKLADAYSTGSSLMPQKKNPDSLELLRGKSGRVFGGMSGFMMSYKGIPSTYNKDLQEDKEPMFDAADTLSGSLQITAGVLSTMQIFPERMRGALSADMLATDLAEYLVRKGVPFRETHHISGAAVKMAEDRGTSLDTLTVEDLKTLHPSFADDVANVWSYETSIDNRTAPGGTSKPAVLDQIKKLQAWLAQGKKL
ncbi:argininosuccinate lyase [Lichtheimia corymbifera JMRC:FSU:9682]|uniref:argininosuccinate lyase n=1 Tax=Lichtheimia corymbifera JMRC:FSU:9682 TaxID=1263082 RepID=A0A068RT66_9FUNG|nr:argininosuccinate lyase [Lichtheimia corymbifera JMRC:FSU:9682]